MTSSDNQCYATADSIQIWDTWTDAGTGSFMCSNNAQIWDTWTTVNNTATSFIDSSNVWGTWLHETNGNVTYHAIAPRGPISPEERAARDRVHAENLEQAKLAKEARQEAKKRAHKLLVENLTAKQRKQFEENDFFDLDVEDSKGAMRRYRINRGTSGNIHLMDKSGRTMRRYCAHPFNSYSIPVEDVMLAQKLMIEHEEEKFVKLANVQFTHPDYATMH